MKLSREEVLHIARLARLGLDEAEIDKFSEQLSNLLEHFRVLQQVRSDDAQASLPPDQVLANAPQKEGDFFRVRPVLG
jgi:aspartyl-tRNA(Asn)/glutamyl-tRNA(Gln) amidotransferase subunit C